MKSRNETAIIKGIIWLLGALLCLPVLAQPPSLILVGLDGFRWDIIDRYPAPALKALAQQGVRAQGVVPVLPVKTFPNFYAIATGLYPQRSGVMDNGTYDPQLQITFNPRIQDDSRWFEGEPIWITAERQGITAATMFWVGSAAENQGMRPSYWHVYDESVPGAARIQQVLDWLDLPLAERPRFISVYFEAIDTASHEFGVDSVQEAAAVAEVDSLVAELMAGIRQRGLDTSTHVIVIGDHGMSNVDLERIVYLDDYVEPALWEPLFSAQLSGDNQGNQVYATFNGPAPAIEALYQRLALAHPALTVYRRGQFPSWFHLDHPQRAPDLVLLPATGWMLSRRAVPYNGSPRGAHGFSPLDRDMHAGFIALGPQFREAAVVEPFAMVDIYNIMARVLGIEPSPNDGNFATIAHLFKD